MFNIYGNLFSLYISGITPEFLVLLTRDSYDLEYYGIRCEYCNAPRFHEELPSWCCSNGTQISPNPWRDLAKDYPDNADRAKITSTLHDLHTLFASNSDLRLHSRLYQSLCAPTSFNTNFIKLPAPSCVYIVGNGYHKYVPADYHGVSFCFIIHKHILSCILIYFTDKLFIPAMAYFVFEDKSIIHQNKAFQKIKPILAERICDLLAQVNTI